MTKGVGGGEWVKWVKGLEVMNFRFWGVACSAGLFFCGCRLGSVVGVGGRKVGRRRYWGRSVEGYGWVVCLEICLAIFTCLIGASYIILNWEGF